MKLILCSVCLAHGAVAYGIYQSVSSGFFVSNTLRNGHFNGRKSSVAQIPSNKENIIEICNANYLNSQIQERKIKKQKGQKFSKYSKNAGLSRKDSEGKLGWRLIGDFGLKTDINTTITFTVDRFGIITNFSVTPFSNDVYQQLSNCLKKIKLVWEDQKAPPDKTTFVKQFICLQA